MKPRIRFRRIQLNPSTRRPEPVYVYVYDDVAAQEEWERCNPPRGPAAEDNRPTS